MPCDTVTALWRQRCGNTRYPLAMPHLRSALRSYALAVFLAVCSGVVAVVVGGGPPSPGQYAVRCTLLAWRNW